MGNSIAFAFLIHGWLPPLSNDERYGEMSVWLLLIGGHLSLGLLVWFFVNRFLIMRLYPLVCLLLLLAAAFVNENPFYIESFAIVNAGMLLLSAAELWFSIRWSKRKSTITKSLSGG